MYRESEKRRYLESDAFIHEEGAKGVAERVFDTVSTTEIQKDLDLASFNGIQVKELLKNINSSSKGYLRLVSKICFEYTNWCKIEGFVDRNIPNFYDYVLVQPIIEELVPLSMIENKYFKEDYVKNMVLNVIKDPMNKFLTYATYKGVCGLNCDDLKYLKYSDINTEEKTVKLRSGKTIFVDDLFINLAKDADNAFDYMPEGTSYIRHKDSETNKRIRNIKYFIYNKSDYIVKSAGIKRSSDEDLIIDQDNENVVVSQSFIIIRFKFIQKQVDNKFITPSNLYKNGLINYIKNKFKEQGITLREAFFEKENKLKYAHAEKMRIYIEEFGSNLNERSLRQEMEEVIGLYE